MDGRSLSKKNLNHFFGDANVVADSKKATPSTEAPKKPSQTSALASNTVIHVKAKDDAKDNKPGGTQKKKRWC